MDEKWTKEKSDLGEAVGKVKTLDNEWLLRDYEEKRNRKEEEAARQAARDI